MVLRMMLLAQHFLICRHKMFWKSLIFEMVYNCTMYKSFKCQNIMLKLLDSITVTAVMYRYGCPFRYKRRRKCYSSKRNLLFRFCFMIKQKYALQHIDHRNCDSTNIFFNSDRKLMRLNFTYLQLSIPFMVFVTKSMRP